MNTRSRVALITGIGRATALALARQGTETILRSLSQKKDHQLAATPHNGPESRVAPCATRPSGVHSHEMLVSR